MQPPLLAARDIASRCYAQKHMWDRAISVLREGVPLAGSAMLGTFGHELASAARLDPREDPDAAEVRLSRALQARTVLDTLLERARIGRATSYDVATVHAGMGELDLAFEWLERAVEDCSMQYAIRQPRYALLHREPRFSRLLARIGVRVREAGG